MNIQLITNLLELKSRLLTPLPLSWRREGRPPEIRAVGGVKYQF